MIFYTNSIGAIWLRNDQVCDFWWFFWELRRYFGPSLHILVSFFLHLKMTWKKLQINTMIICTHGTKIRVFGGLMSILISTFPFQHIYKVLPSRTSFINLVNSGIFSKIVQFYQSFSIGKLHKTSFIATVAIIKIILYKWGIMLVATTSQENKRNAQTPPVL